MSEESEYKYSAALPIDFFPSWTRPVWNDPSVKHVWFNGQLIWERPEPPESSTAPSPEAGPQAGAND